MEGGAAGGLWELGWWMALLREFVWKWELGAVLELGTGHYNPNLQNTTRRWGHYLCQPYIVPYLCTNHNPRKKYNCCKKSKHHK